jgi:hypothetical protein
MTRNRKEFLIWLAVMVPLVALTVIGYQKTSYVILQ